MFNKNNKLLKINQLEVDPKIKKQKVAVSPQIKSNNPNFF